MCYQTPGVSLPTQFLQIVDLLVLVTLVKVSVLIFLLGLVVYPRLPADCYLMRLMLCGPRHPLSACQRYLHPSCHTPWPHVSAALAKRQNLCVMLQGVVSYRTYIEAYPTTAFVSLEPAIARCKEHLGCVVVTDPG